jgi:hypothetical protein
MPDAMLSALDTWAVRSSKKAAHCFAVQVSDTTMSPPKQMFTNNK